MKISKKILFSLSVLIVAFISYGQTLLMNFYQDDAAVIFKLQHIDGQAGSYGSGPFGEGPYKYTITPFIPFYKFFELNPFGYFFVGFLLFLLAAFSLYALASELFKDKIAGFFSAIIFASAYVGSNSMLKISNSWQNNIGLILSVLMFWGLARFQHRKNVFYYFLSLGLFLLQVEFVYIRSHSLIFAILALEMIGLFPLTVLKFFGLILRQLPFWVVFYSRYLGQAVTEASISGVPIKDIIREKIELLPSLVGTLGNIFVIDKLQRYLVNIFSERVELINLLAFLFVSWLILTFLNAKKVVKLGTLVLLILCFILNRYFYSQDLYWYRGVESLLAGALGMYSTILVFAISLAIWPRSKVISLGLVFGLLNIIIQISGYLLKYPEAIFPTAHRYLNYASVGYSIVFGGLTYFYYQLLKKKNISKKFTFIPLLPVIFFVVSNTLFNFRYQKSLVEERSKPTKRFYETLRRYVPSFNKGSVFYFDIATNSKSRTQFSDFFSVGSMPNSTAIAVQYNVDRYDLSLITNYEELLAKLSQGKDSLDRLYTFYYDASLGLVDTTKNSRELLRNGSNWRDVPLEKNTPRSWNLSVDNVFPFSPVVLDFKAKVSAGYDVEYPYPQVGTKQYSREEKRKMIAYLLSKLDYYSRVKVSTLSEWMYQEKVNLSDNNVGTSWRGHRIYWHDNKHEQVTIDLGQIKNVNRVVWINWQHTLTPTSYVILISLDGKEWEVVKEVKGGKEIPDAQKVIEEFSPARARYLKMDITETLSNDAPAISEIEVVDSFFSETDPNEAENFINNPFVNIQSKIEMNEILSQAAPLLFLDVEIVTNKNKFIKRIPINRIDRMTDYSLIFSPGGTLLENVSVNLPYAPLELEIESAKLRNIGIQEAKDRGIIKEFSKN